MTISEIKNVVLIGAGGNLGPFVLDALLANNFKVTVLTRETSTSTFPSNMAVVRTDCSKASLLEAFKNQDAVVSTLGGSALAEQIKIIDTAVEAGVQRFIPSDFGSPRVSEKLPLMQQKLDIVAYLEKTAAAHPSFTWTAIATGGFLDWGLRTQLLGFDLDNHVATIYNSGREKFSGTTLPTIGLAVARTLQRPGPTANKNIAIASVSTTQQEILDTLKSVSGAEWTVQYRTSAEAAKEGAEKLAKNDYSGVGESIRAVFYDGDLHNDLANIPGGLANETLGLPKETLQEIVKKVLSK